MIEKELINDCCIRGYHVYKDADCGAKIGSILKVRSETRPAALVEDKYALALTFNDQTIGHVPKFLSK